jgi:hypothetical protein
MHERHEADCRGATLTPKKHYTYIITRLAAPDEVEEHFVLVSPIPQYTYSFNNCPLPQYFFSLSIFCSAMEQFAIPQDFAANQSREHSSLVWENHRERIKQLYSVENKSLDEVIGAMESDYGFIATYVYIY